MANGKRGEDDLHRRRTRSILAARVRGLELRALIDEAVAAAGALHFLTLFVCADPL
jgi:hypothetical protein